MLTREGPVTFARHNLKAQGITCVNEVIPYVHYSRYRRPFQADSDNCPISEGRGLLSSRSHTLENSRSKEERPAQAIFRQTQTDVSRLRQSALSTLPSLWTIIFPLPN